MVGTLHFSQSLGGWVLRAVATVEEPGDRTAGPALHTSTSLTYREMGQNWNSCHDSLPIGDQSVSGSVYTSNTGSILLTT